MGNYVKMRNSWENKTAIMSKISAFSSKMTQKKLPLMYKIVKVNS